MAWQRPEGMDAYLESTKLCDCGNDELRRRAKGIIKDAETPKDTALNVFSFATDEVIIYDEPSGCQSLENAQERVWRGC